MKTLPEYLTMHVVELEHPVVRHKLGLMRQATLGHREMRGLAAELATLLAVEATRDLPELTRTVQAWSGPVAVGRIDQSAITVVPVLRAGLGMLEGVLQLLPGARVGVVGVQRDERTLEPSTYCSKLGDDLSAQTVLLLDPMLATAGTAIAAVDQLKALGCQRIRALFLVAAPEGIERLAAAHPDVAMYTAAIDLGLDENGYILPGLGDAGDRIFGVTG